MEVIDAPGALSNTAHAWLTRSIHRALEVMDCRGEVRVRIVRDDEMAAAHMEFLGEEGTTDVITFDMTEPGSTPDQSVDPTASDLTAASPAGRPGLTLDTDLLVCIDEAVRQSAPRGHIPEQELLLYVIHGILHCLGHDDHDAQSAAAMHSAEDRVLAAIGIGPTYSAGGAGEELR